jgi:hypothetical protein
MKGLDSPTEHFGRLGDIGDIPCQYISNLSLSVYVGRRVLLDRDARVPNLLRRSSRSE